MEQLIELNDRLMGAPAGALVAIFAVAVGYICKTMPAFNGKWRWIPFTVVCVCTFGFMLLAPTREAGVSLRIWLTKNFIVGFVIGFVAWKFHEHVLKRFIDDKFFPHKTETKSRKEK